MLLVQKLPDRDTLTLRVLGKVFQNHKALERDMKINPHFYDENCEYTTMEIGKFVKISYQKKAVVETVENEKTENEDETIPPIPFSSINTPSLLIGGK